MYNVSETVLPIYINGQCPIIKTRSVVTLNLSSKDSNRCTIVCFDCQTSEASVRKFYRNDNLLLLLNEILPHGTETVVFARKFNMIPKIV